MTEAVDDEAGNQEKTEDCEEGGGVGGEEDDDEDEYLERMTTSRVRNGFANIGLSDSSSSGDEG